MTTGRFSGTSAQPGTSFLTELQHGRVRWDLISPFPQQDLADRQRTEQAVARLTGFLRESVDPTVVDATGRLPEGYHDELAARGYFRLMDPLENGGLGLSSLGAFRVIQAAASWSVPAAFAMASHLGLGAGAYLPLLQDDVADDLRRLLDDGAISGDADTESAGAVNRTRATVAEATADGSGYLISGEKIFIQNGPIARLLRVSATVRDGDRDYIRLFFVDTQAPGFQVRSWHEFLGLKGLPNAALIFDQVFVQKSRMFTGPKGWGTDEEWRLSPELNSISAHGKMFPVGASSLAIAKLCLHWSRDFVLRRTANGRGLDSYEEIQRIVATTAAEVFAMEAVTEWCMLATERHPGIDIVPERTAAKNINSLTCWRIVDRTVSLLGAEGLETARSKARRGAPPLPLERFFRDARQLRTAGGVDFMVSHYVARMALQSHYDEAASDHPGQMAAPSVTRLGSRNAEHLRDLGAQAARFARQCRDLIKRHPDREELMNLERALIPLGQISSELLAISATLARADQLAAHGIPDIAHLADVYCTAARRRTADAWAQLAQTAPPDYASVCASWLHGTGLAFLTSGVVTDVPSAADKDSR
jgi:alkylation response protein AidB-like acyl-CoA dehydrogenase